MDQQQVLHKAKQAVVDYEQLKLLYLQLQQEHTAQAEALHVAHQTTEAARKAKDDLDRELHTLYAQWDTDIKTQSAHFAQLQQHMVPLQRIAVERANTTAELETVHRSVCPASAGSAGAFAAVNLTVCCGVWRLWCCSVAHVCRAQIDAIVKVSGVAPRRLL